MKSVLFISSSINGQASESTQLAQHYLAQLEQREGRFSLIQRDLAREPIPHLDAERFGAFTTADVDLDARQQALRSLSDTLIAELRAADEVVIAMPLYNLGVPSTFKAWIDHVARVGQTFRYTANGPEGLLDDRKVTILATRGGIYQGTPMDTQSEYLRHIFALMGLRDLHFIYAEGLNMGARADTARRSALAIISAQAA